MQPKPIYTVIIGVNKFPSPLTFTKSCRILPVFVSLIPLVLMPHYIKSIVNVLTMHYSTTIMI